MRRFLHVQHVEVAQVGTGVTTLAQRFVNAVHPVVHRDRVQPILHGFRLDQVEVEQPLGAGRIIGEAHGAAGRDEYMVRHGAVGHQVAAQHVVARPISAKQQRAAGRGQVEHEGGARVLEIDQIAVAVATRDQHGVDIRVSGHHVAGHLQRGDGGAAAHLHVNGPGPRRADLIGQFDACGPEEVFLPLLGGAEHQVNLVRLDPGLRQAVLRGPDAHLVGVIIRPRHVLLGDAELVADDRFGDAGLPRDVGRGHHGLRDIHPRCNDARLCGRGRIQRHCSSSCRWAVDSVDHGFISRKAAKNAKAYSILAALRLCVRTVIY